MTTTRRSGFLGALWRGGPVDVDYGRHRPAVWDAVGLGVLRHGSLETCDGAWAVGRPGACRAAERHEYQ